MNDKVSLEEYLELLNKYEELRGKLIHRNNEYYVLKYKSENLQSNWNSLREWLEKVVKMTANIDEKMTCKNALDKMNELEGKDKE